jgi:hypothetical protein
VTCPNPKVIVPAVAEAKNVLAPASVQSVTNVAVEATLNLTVITSRMPSRVNVKVRTDSRRVLVLRGRRGDDRHLHELRQGHVVTGSADIRSFEANAVDEDGVPFGQTVKRPDQHVHAVVLMVVITWPVNDGIVPVTLSVAPPSLTVP